MTSSLTKEERSSPPSKPTLNTLPIRMKKTTAKTLRTIVKRLNRKSIGRKVVADDVIAKALSLIESKHLEEIKTSTYSSTDQLELQYRNYCQKHEMISKDDFLKKLLEAGLPQLANSIPTYTNPSENK